MDNMEEIKAAIKDAAAEAVKTYIAETEPATKAAALVVTKDEADQEWRDAGEFFTAVKNATINPRAEDVRLRGVKATGMNEGVPADGGYLVAPQIAAGIWERMYDTGSILSRISLDSVGANSNGITYNQLNESSRAVGSAYGGVRGYWLNEGATKQASRPTFRQLELKLKKIAALAYATDELLADASAVSSWLSRTVPEVLRFQVENAIYRGDGVGKPLGIMSSPALVTVTRDTASAVKVADLANMMARFWGTNGVWLMDKSVLPQLIQLSVGNYPVFLPSNSITGAPQFTLLGLPALFVEHASALNTTGDIMLADLSQYQAIQKGGVEAATSIHVQFVTDETAFRFVYRIDGAPMWNSALTPLSGGDTLSPFVVLGSASA